jgi:hypothetical protein
VEGHQAGGNLADAPPQAQMSNNLVSNAGGRGNPVVTTEQADA